ncbi:MAG: uracil phosphoribosyltransferase [Prevotellaceae bacterium]|nr:uracil phosphoribosyltransferase [Prevotellaceae bacterium]
MKIVDFSKTNTVINQFILELRDKNIQQNRLLFRNNVERIGMLMAFEASKELDYETKNVETVLGTAQCNVPTDDIVLCTIMRAGLPFHQGFLNIFDKAENAFVSAYRAYTDETHFEIHTEYLASPRIDGKTLMIVDPMLATGSSIETTLHVMQSKGTPKRVIIASVIAAEPAFDKLRGCLPEDSIVYCAAVDDVLNEHKYIVPGLGDAGDLLYGTKE